MGREGRACAKGYYGAYGHTPRESDGGNHAAATEKLQRNHRHKTDGHSEDVTAVTPPAAGKHAEQKDAEQRAIGIAENAECE